MPDAGPAPTLFRWQSLHNYANVQLSRITFTFATSARQPLHARRRARACTRVRALRVHDIRITAWAGMMPASNPAHDQMTNPYATIRYPSASPITAPLNATGKGRTGGLGFSRSRPRSQVGATIAGPTKASM